MLAVGRSLVSLLVADAGCGWFAGAAAAWDLLDAGVVVVDGAVPAAVGPVGSAGGPGRRWAGR